MLELLNAPRTFALLLALGMLIRPAFDQRPVSFETTQGTAINVDISPNGETIVFDLLGDIYTIPITGGRATRLTSGPSFDTEPVFSRDAKRIAFVSDRSGSENIWIMDADGRNGRAFTKETTTAVTGPEWIAGGEFVLVARRPDGYWRYRADGTGTALMPLLPERARPGRGEAAWSRDGRFIYAADGGSISRVDIALGEAEELRYGWPDGFRPAVSADGKWVVFGAQVDNKTGLRLLNVVTEDERWLVYPLPDRDNSMLHVKADAPGAPPALPRFAFMPDGRAIVIATGGTFQRVDLRTGVMRAIPFWATVEHELGPRAALGGMSLPEGIRKTAASIAFEGATVITMRGDEVLRDATVLVTGSRIAAVGSRGAIALPAGVRRLDVTGKTVIPGLIDLRGQAPIAGGLPAGTNLLLAANLAFGVTTVRAFPTAKGNADSALLAMARVVERLEAGATTGARLLVGGAVTEANAAELSSPEAGQALVRRQQALGATAIVQAVALTRRQRQWLAAAAREAGIPLMGGTGDLKLALSMVSEGYHTIQGTIPNAQLYDDIRRFLAASQTVYVPTLLDATGGINGGGTAEDYFLEAMDVRQDPKLRRFGLVGSGFAQWRLLEDYHFLAVGQQARRLEALGAPVAVGTAGKRPGLGVHWEMWALEMSGFSPHDALRAATVSAAEALGLMNELGTVEAGKMADLVVLDADPLADLKHSRATRYVMRNGELFDATTLAMIWPRATAPLSVRDTRDDPPPLPPEDIARTAGDTAEPIATRAREAPPPREAAASGAVDGLPIQPARTISFETTEGTAMNLDLSPDGQTIAFDLLGDIYAVPAAGGAATQLTRGLSFDQYPVWSPDGWRIAYISDGTGAENLWLMAADGSNRRPVTREDHRDFVNLDNVRRRFTEVQWTPDGQLVSRDTIYDLNGGKRPFTHPPDSLRQPVVSPNGKWVAYIAPGGTEPFNGLRVRHVETGEDRWLVYPIGERRNRHERYVFTHDSKAVLISYGGKLHRIDVATGDEVIVPFKANVNVDLGPFAHHRHRVTNDSLTVGYIRSPTVSPDGKFLVFQALQRIYQMAIPSGVPQPLVNQPYVQFHPAYSPDGNWIAYVTSTDAQGGHVWRVPAAGGKPQRLTSVAGYYQRPAWSPDGTTLAILKSPRWIAREGGLPTASLQLLPSTGGTPRTIASGVSRTQPVTFTSDGQGLLFQTGFPAAKGELVSIRLDGRDRRVVARVADASMPSIAGSPDGRYAAYVFSSVLYLAPLTGTHDAVTLSHSNIAVPVVRILQPDALDLRWGHGPSMLTWISASEVYRINADSVMAAAARTARRRVLGGSVVVPHEVTRIRLTAPRQAARGTLALRGARVITMRGDEVVEDATVVVANDRIAAVGPSSAVEIPAGAKVLDVRRMTIMPGLVDLHAHFAHPIYDDVVAQSQWSLLANLAYGVTTARDVSSTTHQFGYAELIETGQMLGPRLFSVGLALDQEGTDIKSLEHARAIVRQRKAMGAVALKQYQQRTRRQRRWLLIAAREAGLNVTTHGDMLTMVLDGSPGIEHSLPNAAVFGDVTRLIAAAKTWYTPTLQVGGWGGSYFHNRYRLHDDPKYRRFVSHRWIDPVARSGPQLRDRHWLDASRGAAAILHRGGNVTVGSHGDDQGVGAHWEIWMLQMGGLTNYEALRAGTLIGAEGLGMQQDLGSIEVGKLADLLVVDENPLENIENTLTIRYVMKNGVLYEGHTLNTVWPAKRALPEWMYPNHWESRESPERASALRRAHEGKVPIPDPRAAEDSP